MEEGFRDGKKKELKGVFLFLKYDYKRISGGGGHTY